MGQIPSIANATNLAKAEEYHGNCTLSRLADVYVFWFNSVHNSLISHAEFDLLFGSVPGLTGSHFQLFADDSIGRAPFHEILYVMIMVANDTIVHKVYFLMKLRHLCSLREEYRSVPVYTGDMIIHSSYVYETFYIVIRGLQRLFDITIPEHLAVQRYWETNIEELNIRIRENLHDDQEKDQKRHRHLQELTIRELYDLCLDLKISSEYLGALEVICDHLTVHGKYIRQLKNFVEDPTTASDVHISKMQICSYVVQEMEAERSREAEKKSAFSVMETFSSRIAEKNRHLLWTYVVMDVGTDAWYTDPPVVWRDDPFFRVLELLILSGRDAIPVFHRPKTAVVASPPEGLLTSRRAGDGGSTGAGADGSGGGSSGGHIRSRGRVVKPRKGPIVADNSQPDKKDKNDTREKKEKKETKGTKLFGIVDDFALFHWIAECCPESLRQEVMSEECERWQQLAALDDQRSAFLDQHPECRLLVDLPATRSACHNVGRLRDILDRALAVKTAAAAALAAAAQKAGATSDGLIALTATTLDPSQDRSIWEIKRRREGSLWTTVGESIVCTLLEAVASNPLTATTPAFQPRKRSDSLQTDDYLYHVMTRISRGERHVGVAQSAEHPHIVTHLVTSLDVVAFLRSHGNQFPSEIMFSPIAALSLMKRPVCIDGQKRLGVAMLIMCSKRVDAAIITHPQTGLFAGVMSTADVVKRLWYGSRSVVVRRVEAEGAQKEAEAAAEVAAEEAKAGDRLEGRQKGSFWVTESTAPSLRGETKGSQAVLPKGSQAVLPKGSHAVLPKGSQAVLPKGSQAVLPGGPPTAVGQGSLVSPSGAVRSGSARPAQLGGVGGVGGVSAAGAVGAMGWVHRMPAVDTRLNLTLACGQGPGQGPRGSQAVLSGSRGRGGVHSSGARLPMPLPRPLHSVGTAQALRPAGASAWLQATRAGQSKVGLSSAAGFGRSPTDAGHAVHTGGTGCLDIAGDAAETCRTGVDVLEGDVHADQHQWYDGCVDLVKTLSRPCTEGRYSDTPFDQAAFDLAFFGDLEKPLEGSRSLGTHVYDYRKMFGLITEEDDSRDKMLAGNDDNEDNDGDDGCMEDAKAPVKSTAPLAHAVTNAFGTAPPPPVGLVLGGIDSRAGVGLKIGGGSFRTPGLKGFQFQGRQGSNETKGGREDGRDDDDDDREESTSKQIRKSTISMVKPSAALVGVGQEELEDGLRDGQREGGNAGQKATKGRDKVGHGMASVVSLVSRGDKSTQAMVGGLGGGKGDERDKKDKGDKINGRRRKGKTVEQVDTAQDQDQARRAEMAHVFTTWGLVLPTDHVMGALEAMHRTQRTRAFVVSEQGEPLGVVSLQDICQQLVEHEEHSKRKELLKQIKENRSYF